MLHTHTHTRLSGKEEGNEGMTSHVFCETFPKIYSPDPRKWLGRGKRSERRMEKKKRIEIFRGGNEERGKERKERSRNQKWRKEGQK